MFNPFKNVKLEQLEPKLDAPEIQNSDEIHFKEEVLVNQNFSNSSFEGVKISDLQESGLNTISLLKLASKKMENKNLFNIPLLETIYLPFIIEQLGGVLKKPNVYIIYEQEISLKPEESKWYNFTKKKGGRNAISLVKHLIAIKEKVDEFEEKNTLFISACKKLTELQKLANKHENNFVTNEKSNNLNHSDEVNLFSKNNNINNSIQENNSKPKIDWKARDEALNSIPLSLLFEELGAHNNEDGQSGKWKIYDTGENVGLTGDFKWYSWNANLGGIGAISYMKHHVAKLQNLNLNSKEDNTIAYKIAVQELLKMFGSELGNFDYEPNTKIEYKKPFSMPHVIDFKINQVINYLHEKRGLPLWVINKQIQAGFIFAGYPSDWPNPPKTLFNPDKCKDEDIWATFLSINGEAAEMRAIKRTDNFAKILASGSSKELGGFLIKAEKKYSERTVAALEAAIDTCSYHVFYPGRIATSCMGVNFNLAVKAALEVIEKNLIITENYENPENYFYKFQLAFDNDLAGNEAAVRFKERMIEELGEDEYKKLKDNGIINYFDLSIRCFKESIKNNDIYYFDVLNNPIGKEAAIMFQEALSKEIGIPLVRNYLKEGKLKYINLWPNFSLMTNPEKEAEIVYNLLCLNKPFYLKIKKELSEDEEKNVNIKHKKELFINTFKKLSKDCIEQWEKEGKIIYHKKSIAKDWNEYLLYQKEKPEFKNYFENLELEFGEKYNIKNTDSYSVKNKKLKIN
jgi:hypothetical protein